jgi:sulfatase modifying factor 1
MDQEMNNMKTTFYLLLFIFLLPACKQNIENESMGLPDIVQNELILIHGGEFTMGHQSSPDATYVDEYVHLVHVDSFYIEKYEVTNSQYKAFCDDTGRRLPEFWGMDIYKCGPNFPDYPVVGVTWADAMAYAKWKGFRLPTEAEWEYAARGGLIGKSYPSGNEMDSTMANYYPVQGHTMPVGSYPPNGYGLYDMAGNVVEWVYDFYSKNYYLESPYENPSCPFYGKRRVIRGGGWRSGIGCITVYFRQSLRPYWVDFNVGFRCAKDITKI